MKQFNERKSIYNLLETIIFLSFDNSGVKESNTKISLSYT